jgi:hypothetical protein
MRRWHSRCCADAHSGAAASDSRPKGGHQKTFRAPHQAVRTSRCFSLADAAARPSLGRLQQLAVRSLCVIREHERVDMHLFTSVRISG